MRTININADALYETIKGLYGDDVLELIAKVYDIADAAEKRGQRAGFDAGWDRGYNEGVEYGALAPVVADDITPYQGDSGDEDDEEVAEGTASWEQYGR